MRDGKTAVGEYFSKAGHLFAIRIANNRPAHNMCIFMIVTLEAEGNLGESESEDVMYRLCIFICYDNAQIAVASTGTIARIWTSFHRAAPCLSRLPRRLGKFQDPN